MMRDEVKRVNKYLKFLPEDAVYSTLKSPVGQLTIFVSDQGVHSILWEHECSSDESKLLITNHKQSDSHPILFKAKQQLAEYFDKARTSFDIPVALAGTDFQIKAWQALQTIPYGETISYGEQARRLGDKNKARAVGMANGMNPISIIIPCHRVIGASGALTGFGGGLDNKSYLLNLEQKTKKG